MKYYLKMEIKESYPNLSFVEFCQMKFFYNNIQITTDENNLIYPSKSTSIAGWYCKNIMYNSQGITNSSPSYVLFELPTKFDKFTFKNGDLDGSQIKSVEYYILQSETIPSRTDIRWKFQGLYQYQQVTETKTVLVSFYNVKYLLKDNINNIKYIDNNNNILNLGTITPTLQDYSTYGFNDLTKLDNTKIKLLSKFKILSYCDDTTVNFKTKIKVVPNPQLILMKTDIDISNVDKINSMSLTSNSSTNGIVKIIVSFDRGITWKSYDNINKTWVIVDASDLNNIKINGITKEIFNAITSTDWETFRNSSKALRLGYYLEVSDISDVANLDNLTINCNMQGEWLGVINGNEYRYSYKSNTKLTIMIYSSGTYKINYPQ